jgi:long-chain acyl-CoA synthetase
MEKIWIQNYPPNVASYINASAETLVSLFDKTCFAHKDKTAFNCDNNLLSFTQTQQLVNNFANALIALGVKKSDRVAIMLPNILQFPVVLFAILKIGAIVVNINPLYTSNEIDYLLKDSEAKVLITLNIFAEKLNKLFNKYELRHVIVTEIGDLYNFPKNIWTNSLVKIAKFIPLYKRKYPVIHFKNLMQQYAQQQNTKQYEQINSDDIAFIQYTSGTTGHPKGAVLRHKNIVANINQITTWLSVQISLKDHVVIAALPMYHIFSLTANLFLFFFNGGENVLITNPRNINALINTMQTSNFTIFNSLDTLHLHLLNAKHFSAAKFPFYKYCIIGGMVGRKSLALQWQQATGVLPTNCYGMTEASPAITMNKINDSFDGSVGYPLPSTEIEIRDPKTNNPLPFGEIGDIFIRGPQVMQGYWHKPEVNKTVFTADGWFKTSELGYISAEGKLFIAGRNSDMIIVSGFNVYPAEVENIISLIVGVKEVAVIGTTNDTTGEQVVACIVKNKKSRITPVDIINSCKEDLAEYKIPHKIIFVKQLPKTLIGKIDKVALLQSIKGK